MKTPSLIESTSQNMANFRSPTPAPKNILENLYFHSEADLIGHRILTFSSPNFIIFLIVKHVTIFYKI